MSEKQLTNLLIDLKENYSVLAVKAEFEEEGAEFDEVVMLKEIAQNAGVKLTVKIGGCGALRDLRDAKKLNADNIVAPMIETPYALKKFVKNFHKVFYDNDIKSKNFFINIETITSVNNLSDIILAKEFALIDGIVLGRSDLSASLGLTSVNSDKISDISKVISEKLKKTNKQMIIGGGISYDSMLFFEKLPYMTGFETRKIVFNAENKKYNQAAVTKALEFELMWLENKNYQKKEDLIRIQKLKNIIR